MIELMACKLMRLDAQDVQLRSRDRRWMGWKVFLQKSSPTYQRMSKKGYNDYNNSWVRQTYKCFCSREQHIAHRVVRCSTTQWTNRACSKSLSQSLSAKIICCSAVPVMCRLAKGTSITERKICGTKMRVGRSWAIGQQRVTAQCTLLLIVPFADIEIRCVPRTKFTKDKLLQGLTGLVRLNYLSVPKRWTLASHHHLTPTNPPQQAAPHITWMKPWDDEKRCWSQG